MILLILSLVLALLVSWTILSPFYETESEPKSEKLGASHAQAMQMLEDLEYDFRGGKIAQEQYDASRRELITSLSEQSS